MRKQLKKCFIFSLFYLFLLISCGGGPKTPSAPATRSFPSVEIPAMLTEGPDRLDYMATHLWNRYLDTTSLYLCDSLHFNGVEEEDLEQQMGLYATLLENISAQNGKNSISAFYRQLEGFGLRYPESRVFPKLSELLNKYLYDPNSPVRNEDLWGVYAAHLAESPLVEDSYKPKYRYEADLCSRNPVGSVATDFAFTDTRGRVRTLHGIKAGHLLLVFGNPGCTACRELVEQMERLPGINAAISDGRLKVVDVFIDPEIDQWKAQVNTFPKNWICGYDHRMAVTEERLYHVRGIPSLYLLDENKKILLKDAPQEKVLDYLAGL